MRSVNNCIEDMMCWEGWQYMLCIAAWVILLLSLWMASQENRISLRDLALVGILVVLMSMYHMKKTYLRCKKNKDY